jgi:serine/threonine protein phosphatase PrpC
MPLKHSVAWTTRMGRSHQVNQDACGAWSWTRADGLPASLLVVADGVSAGRRSEDASRIAVDCVYKRTEPLLSGTVDRLGTLREALIDAALEANLLIARRPHVDAASADSTTLVAAICLGGHGVGLWCGDSRAYHARADGTIERVTRDHSWAEAAVNSGSMTAEQASLDPRAHMITRWLGPPIDRDPGIDVFRFELQPGDTAVCCSDGLSMYFTPPAGDEQEIGSVLRDANSNLSLAMERLSRVAEDRGGRDDITAVALRVEAA